LNLRVFSRKDARRQGLHASDDVVARESLCHERLDFGLGLPSCRRDQIVGILGRHVGRDERSAGQVEATLRDRGEQASKLPADASHANALARNVLGEPELADAVVEHRRVAGGSSEPALVHFADVGQHERGRLAILVSEGSQVSNQRVVAVADGAVSRGWIPENFPAEAVAIHEAHDLDSNDSWVRFELAPARALEFAATLRDPYRADPERVDFHQPCEKDWWVQGLMQQQPWNDHALVADIHAGWLPDGRHAVVAIQKRTSRVYVVIEHDRTAPYR
jgi:hypothetical protein